ncbi:hypothetical protein [Oceanobacillus sp. Castelsardo]|uniref:hypothetical protein n=1 Tax=Oceanobacillus sp. Castelsardo TaxID=1851204 RepID=UPI000838DD2B|nr:hypothetical protein [Oceanobacillus sp. Castelsardo]
MYPKFQEFLPAIKNLNPNWKLTKEDLLIDEFLIEKEGRLSMYYAPHNEYINSRAIIVIVGITPGWNQMKMAFEKLLQGLESHHPTEQMLKEAKKAASFSGSMRANLVQMLDECGIHKAIHVQSSSSLFEEQRELLHTTSTIKYPVFYEDKNYNGYQPSFKKSPLLVRYAFDIFPKELYQIKESALIIPLGKTVEHVFYQLRQEGGLPNHFYLFGFPHPSGANGHRKKQFDQRRESFISIVKAWAKQFE